MLKRPALLILAAALAAGCTRKNTVSVEPAALCSMPDDCTFSSKCDAQTIDTSTIYDVRGQTRMWLAVEMHNQLTNSADETLGQANSHDAHFESYSITYEGSGGLLDPTGEIPAAGGPTQQNIPANGTAVIGFDAILQSAANSLVSSTAVPVSPNYAQVVAHVTFKGRYDDGDTWSAPFTVPIRICRDCLGDGCAFGEQPTQACPSIFQRPAGAITCTKVPTCLTAGTECAVRVLNSATDTLYSCSGYGAEAIPLEICSLGCIQASPNPDFCQPPPVCQAIGIFCGGTNVLNGDATTLYTCGIIGSAPSSETTCPNGCNALATPNVCTP